MKLNKIKLINFRNYKDLELSFDGSRNIIFGENGQGKTNLLEAVYLCAFGRSFRTNNAAEMVMIGEDSAFVKVEAESEDLDKRIQIVINKNGDKIIKKDGKKIKRTGELLKNFVVVVFSPEDLRLIKDEPEKRRRFLNKEISQISPKYYECVLNYNKVLKNKRNILKEWNLNPCEDLLDITDIQLAKYGTEIIKYRKKYVDMLCEYGEKIQNDITEGKENLKIKYIPSLNIIDANEYYEKIKKERWIDINEGKIHRGPHKDDIEFYVNGKNARKYGSQGQQRTAALAVKMAEIEIINKIIGENPVLILDDVMSELDSIRQKYVINKIENIQVFISTTEIKNEILKENRIGKIIKINNGIAEEIKAPL